MRAPRAETSPEVVDLSIERNPGVASRPAETETAGRQKPIVKFGKADKRPAGKKRAAPVAEANRGLRIAVPEGHTKLRGRIAELEAENSRLAAQLRGLYDRRDTAIAALEDSLKSMGEELGRALAEKSAAELHAERATGATEKLREERQPAISEADGAAGAAPDLAALTARLQCAVAEHERARAEADELRELLVQRASEWESERAALTAECDAAMTAQSWRGDVPPLRTDGLSATAADVARLQAALEELREDAQKAFAESATAQLRAEEIEAARAQIAEVLERVRNESQAAKVEATDAKARAAAAAAQASAAEARAGTVEAQLGVAEARATKAEAQATWSALQLAELVEREAAAAARRDDEADRRIKEAAVRLLGRDYSPDAGAVAILREVHGRLRRLERELDQAEVERDHLRVTLLERAAPKGWFLGILDRILPLVRSAG